jgi:hypothetical protein
VSIGERRHRPDLLAAMAGRLATALARGGEEELVCIGGQTWEARRAEHEKNKKKEWRNRTVAAEGVLSHGRRMR